VTISCQSINYYQDALVKRLHTINIFNKYQLVNVASLLFHVAGLILFITDIYHNGTGIRLMTRVNFEMFKLEPRSRGCLIGGQGDLASKGERRSGLLDLLKISTHFILHPFTDPLNQVAGKIVLIGNQVVCRAGCVERL